MSKNPTSYSEAPTSTFRVRRSLLLSIGVLFSTGGASCQQLLNRNSSPIPRVLPPAATLAQVIQVVNNNSSKVQSFSTTRAGVSTPGYPGLRANLAFQRPRSFRLRGGLAISSSPEVDLGSNDELFWFWVARETPPAMYFCRHDQFATSAARQVLPVEPDWIAQAMGLISFESNEIHDGPYPVRGGKLEIRSTSPGPNGARRVTIIDDASGVVLEQHVYDAQGTRVASAVMTGHQLDPTGSGVVMPRQVRIEWPTSHFELNIELNDLQINRLSADPAALFTKPDYPGYINTDLGAPHMMGTANVAVPLPNAQPPGLIPPPPAYIPPPPR